MLKITKSYLSIALGVQSAFLIQFSLAMNSSEDTILNSESINSDQMLILGGKEFLRKMNKHPEKVRRLIQNELTQMQSLIEQYEGTLKFVNDNMGNPDPAVQERVQYFIEAKAHTEQEISNILIQVGKILQEISDNIENQKQTTQFSNLHDNPPSQQLLGQQIAQQLKEQQNESLNQLLKQNSPNQQLLGFSKSSPQGWLKQQMKYQSKMHGLLALSSSMNQNIKK